MDWERPPEGLAQAWSLLRRVNRPRWQEGEDNGDLPAIQDLPYHIFKNGGGQDIKPCAEVYLNEKAALTILEAGLMPLLSVRTQNHALIPPAANHR